MWHSLLVFIQCNNAMVRTWKKSQHYKKNLLLWKKNWRTKKKIVKLPRVRSIPNDHVTTWWNKKKKKLTLLYYGDNLLLSFWVRACDKFEPVWTSLNKFKPEKTRKIMKKWAYKNLLPTICLTKPPFTHPPLVYSIDSYNAYTNTNT